MDSVQIIRARAREATVDTRMALSALDLQIVSAPDPVMLLRVLRRFNEQADVLRKDVHRLIAETKKRIRKEARDARRAATAPVPKVGGRPPDDRDSGSGTGGGHGSPADD